MSNLLGGNPYSVRPLTKNVELADWLRIELRGIEQRVAGASHRVVTADYEVRLGDGLILCDTTGGAISITFPTPLSRTEDWLVTIKRVSATANSVTIVGTVDGAANPTLAAQYKSVTLWSDGVTLHKIASI